MRKSNYGLAAGCLLLTLGLAIAQPPNKFDFRPVRDDFFASFGSEPERLDRAIAACEAALAADPKNPEALVWHGCSIAQRGVRMLRSGQYEAGRALWEKGLAEMDAAVKLRPNRPEVLVPRASYLLPAARFTPDPAETKRLLERVVSDYEISYAVQKPGFDRLSQHSRGELLLGLAEAYLRLGRRDRAGAHLNRVTRDLKDTPWARDARVLLALKPDQKPGARACVGCHE